MIRDENFGTVLGKSVLVAVIVLILTGFLLRFSPIVIPWISDIKNSITSIKDDIKNIKEGLSEIEPPPIVVPPRSGSKKVAGVGGIAQIVKREGMFAYIAEKYTKSGVFKRYQKIRISNLGAAGEPSVVVPILGTFKPEEKGVVVQLSQQAAEVIKFSLPLGRTSVWVESIEEK